MSNSGWRKQKSGILVDTHEKLNIEAKKSTTKVTPQEQKLMNRIFFFFNAVFLISKSEIQKPMEKYTTICSSLDQNVIVFLN